MRKILILILSLFPTVVFALTVPELNSDKYLIYDLTEEVILHEKGFTEKTSIASLTKIMTTITAIEKNPELEKIIEINEQMLNGIPWDASIAGIKVGEKLSIKDLIYASILPSGADATQALAVESSGSVKTFVEDMNQLAKRIGAKNTNFINVTGYDIEGHYSTLEDLLTIIKYALNNKTFKKVFETREYTLSNSKTVYSTLITYNKLMNLDTSRILGSKTGFTKNAGVCIAATIKSSEHDILIITLGAPYVYGDFYNLKDALKLTEFLDKNYGYQSIIKKGDIVKTIPIELSKKEEYEIKATEDVKCFLPIDYDKNKISIKYDGKNELDYRDIKGNTIGKIIYYYDNKALHEERVVLDAEIERDYLKILKTYIVPFSLGLTILIVLLIILKIIKQFKKQKRRKKN